VTLPREELERIWTPEYLERLARTYWRFLERVSLGVLRVLYTQSGREIVLLRRPLVLLRFFAPEYEIQPDGGSVTWQINRGLLVAPGGRGKGHLRISVRRTPEAAGAEQVSVSVTSEVASFYPTLTLPGVRIAGRLTAFGRALYEFTQLRIHVVVTNAFLRSLAQLDLVPSVVGALRPPPPPEPAQAGPAGGARWR
jgi:hypothetical protein